MAKHKQKRDKLTGQDRRAMRSKLFALKLPGHSIDRVVADEEEIDAVTVADRLIDVCRGLPKAR
jgi:hypothetical protein